MVYGALALVFLAVMLALMSPLLFAAIASDLLEQERRQKNGRRNKSYVGNVRRSSHARTDQ
tara:strand:- start:55 stop:237 length:183 start_codon:yes stop_codon:yes gene_type:complete